MASKITENRGKGNLDFLTEILVDGQEFEFDFSSYRSKNYIVSGKIKIQEQDILVKPKRGAVNSPKTEAWMCAHPKYWKILCGLEPADTKTNIKIMGMLVRTGLYELSQMMCRRIDVMISPASADELERLMPAVPDIDDED